MSETFPAPFVIAVDGPAASGKGTLARELARFYGLPHLDTGLSYRAVAAILLENGVSLDDEASAVEVAKKLDFSALNPAILSLNEIGEAASKVAVMPLLRESLVACQRAFSQTPPGAVLDGRDIGTVVCPNADVKLYIIADVTVRARRRCDELVAKGVAADYDRILLDLERRDARDMTRKEGPLRPADDAHLLDTTNLSINAAFEAARAIVDLVWQKRER